MAAVAAKARLKLQPKGQLGREPLFALVGTLGRLSATCVLQVSCRRLVRRVVLSGGVISAVVSNALEDRLLEWSIAAGRLELSPASAARLRSMLGQRPLAGACMLREGAIDPPTLARLLEQHAAAMVLDMGRWREGEYEIHPGRLEIGDESSAGLPAMRLALDLAREPVPRGAPHSVAPTTVAAAVDASELEDMELTPTERQVLTACARPMRRDEIRRAAPELDGEQVNEAVSALWRCGLLEARSRDASDAKGEPRFDAQGEPTRDEIERFLSAAEARDFEDLIGVLAGEDVATVRAAYYRTVRRFHPDRFRQGRYAEFHGRIERAFRLVQEAESTLTDPEKLRTYRARTSTPAAERDDAKMVAGYLASARQSAAKGQRADAVTLLERGLAIAPDDPDLRLAHGLVLAGNPRKRREAADDLRRLSDASPDRADLLTALFLVLRVCGADEEAGVCERRARRLDPSDRILRALDGDAEAVRECGRNPFIAPLLASGSGRS
jgi:tetratricopeptide (TPR) repeat protein